MLSARLKRYLKWLIVGVPLYALGFVVTTLLEVFGVYWMIGYWVGFYIMNLVAFFVTEYVTYYRDLGGKCACNVTDVTIGRTNLLNLLERYCTECAEPVPCTVSDCFVHDIEYALDKDKRRIGVGVK